VNFDEEKALGIRLESMRVWECVEETLKALTIYRLQDFSIKMK